MRNGRLLAEDSPNILLERFNTQYLEDVFLILCSRQEEDKTKNVSPSSAVNEVDSVNLSTNLQRRRSLAISSTSLKEILKTERAKSITGVSKNLIFSRKRVQSLLRKNWIQHSKNVGAIFVSLLFPIIQMTLFFVAIGADVKDIKFAIVNDENTNEACSKINANNTVIFNDDTCDFNSLSCRFLDELNDPMIDKRYYSNIDVAIDAVQTGEVVGAMYISKNFSKAYGDRLNNGLDMSNETLEDSQINIWMDMSSNKHFFCIQT